jgi:hypothetical protein
LLLIVIGGGGVRVVSGGGGCRGRGCLAHGARGSIERLGGGRGGGDLAVGGCWIGRIFDGAPGEGGALARRTVAPWKGGSGKTNSIAERRDPMTCSA